jgi:hypothetical protein
MLVLLEVLFRTLIPVGHHPYFEMYEEDGFVIGKYSAKNGSESTKTIGMFGQISAKWRINNHGWNNEIDYQYERNEGVKRVAIIGDSYVEAINLDYDKSFIALANHELKGKFEFYSFGIGGAPLSQYLHFCRFVDQKYQPDAFVFVLANNDIDESMAHFGEYRNLVISEDANGNFIEHHPKYFPIEDDPLVNTAKQSALVRYLFYNLQIYRIVRLLRFDFNKDKQPDAVVNSKEIRTSTDVVAKLTSYLMSEIKKTTGERPVIFIQDGNRANIYAEKAPDVKMAEVSAIIQNNTDSLGFHFIDLESVFTYDYFLHQKKHNHFSDYHWNAYGHQVIADTFTNTITTLFERTVSDSSAIHPLKK